MFIDAHFHASAYARIEGTLKPSLDTLAKEGILVLSNSVDIESYELTRALAKDYDHLVPCFGIHPQTAPEHKDKLDSYTNYFNEVEIYGEIGLDNQWIKDETQYPIQEKVLHKFLSNAQKHNKIVVLHLDGAEKKGLEFMQNYSLKDIIIHGYSGSIDILKQLIDYGCFISLGSDSLIEQRLNEFPIEVWQNFQEIVREIPSDLLLIETDGPLRVEPNAPDTAPRTLPNFIVGIYNNIARIRQTQLSDLKPTIIDNVLRLFKNHPSLQKYTTLLSNESSY